MTTLVLVVAEGPARSRRLVTILRDGGFDVELAHDSSAGLLLAAARGADALLFDADGVEADSLRQPSGRRVCSLVAWTSGSSSLRAARLLDGGADEVLHDGMTAEEILARVRKAVGGTPTGTPGVLELGSLRIDLPHGEVLWAGHEVRLSGREREVLYVLAESAGRPVRRDVLYRRVWGYTMARGDRTVDVNVKRLRAKLAAAGAAVAIETRPTVGYRLEVITDEAPLHSPPPARAAAAAGPPAA